MIPRLHRWSLSSLFQRDKRDEPAPKRVKSDAGREQRVRNPYHAVSIVFDRGAACRAARDFANQRFLAGRAPNLPLAGCDCTGCTCRYEHHDDRRGDPRRASDEWRAEHPYVGPERRGRRGRRRKDLVRS